MKKEEFKKLFKTYHKKMSPDKLLFLIEQTKIASERAQEICDNVLKSIEEYKIATKEKYDKEFNKK